MSTPAAPETAPAPASTSPPEGTTAPRAAAAPPAAPYQPPAPGNAPPSASLYVGELDPAVTEGMLYEIFSTIGTVASVRVCRDAVTRRSLGYAYVNYVDTTHGQNALEHLNYSLIKGRPCRIMWSQRDPALRKTGQGNIFIKNLDEQIDNKALHDTFAAFGTVLSCKVAVDDHGQSKGYGFVHYETAEAADAAIEAVNGMLLNDKKVYVGYHVSRKERQSKIEEMKSQFTNVYVKNLDPEQSQEDFEALFKKYGNVTSAIVQRDHEGKSKGFGFVNYEKHEEAQAAVDGLHESEQNGRKLFVTRAQKKQEREEELRKSYEKEKQEKMAKYHGVNLYVKNLEDDVNDDKLRSEFEPFGTITSCKVMCDEKTGASKGFGFVCFSTPEEATKAVAEMNNKMIGSKPLYVSLAQRREVRRQQLESQIAQRNQIRSQQMAVGGMPGFINPQMYYPGPAGFAPPGRGMMSYGQPGMMPPRPRYAPNGAPIPGMPLPNPYGAPPPQGYGPPMAGYPRGGAPRPAGQRGPGGSPPTAADVPPAAQAPTNGANNAARPANGTRAPGPAAESSGLNSAALSAASPTEQKQMLGEVIYMRIANSHPELAGKITGMLLEMDNAELIHLLETPDAMNGKVNEALAVLKEFSKEP